MGDGRGPRSARLAGARARRAALGRRAIANLLFSGARTVTFEPVLSAVVELNAGPTITLGAGPTVNLLQPAVDGAIISASFGARSLARVQVDLRLGAAQPRVDLGLRLDLVGVFALVREFFGVLRVSSVAVEATRHFG